MKKEPVPLLIRLQDYLVCVLLHLMFPLLPLGLEYWTTQNIAETSLTLMASVYAISIGLSSSSPLLFGIGILVSFVFSFAFGMTSALHQGAAQQIPPLPYVKELAMISIMLIFIMQASERFKRHIIQGKRFWTWYSDE